MQVVTALLLTAISAMVDTIAPAGPSTSTSTSTTSKSGFLSIIQPPSDVPIVFGKPFRITWIITNRSDEDLNSGIIGFELLDASDSDNLVPLETLISNVNVAASQISAVIPETTKVVKSYGIRSVYHDAGALRYCSSPVFEVTVPNTPLNPAVTISIVLTCHTPRATSADRICSVTEFRP
ncbi:hypothetical protein BJ741DRAFT_714803 [Chytriomyces cf. hyalinus JEL632]|nr:hypothetical protein BJ741DRAFT_714803 [Chytriomyces cf. hyalinus JEL632]